MKNSEKKEKCNKKEEKLKKDSKELIKKDTKRAKGKLKSIFNVLKNKWLKNTTMTVVLIAIIIGAYIGINFVFEKLNLTDIDFTKSKMFTLSEASKTKIKDIDKEVNITLINLSEYQYLIDYANKYTQLNKNIKVEQIDDLVSRVDLKEKYNLQDTSQIIIIKTEENDTTLSMYDLTTYDYSTGEQIDRTEEAITNAIVNITLEDKPKIYFLTGHNKYPTDYFNVLLSKLEDEANEVKTWDILINGDIPEDTDCLIITTLKDDLTELERDEILKYIINGGNIMLLNDPNPTDTEMSNFNKILETYGISMPKGIVFEQEDSRMLYGSPVFVKPTIEHNPNSSNVNMEIDFCLLESGIIEFEESDKLKELGIEYTKIAQTSGKAFLRTNYSIQTLDKTDSDEDASHKTVAAIVTKTINDETKSKLVVYANSAFATNMEIPLNQMYYTYAIDLRNNQDMILNSISYLTERTDTIIIRKDNDSVKYTVTKAQNNIILIIIFSIPALIVITGIVVWQVRRRRK